MFKNIDIWIGEYLRGLLEENLKKRDMKNDSVHILFSLCDHFEPYWNNNDHKKAYERVENWVQNYPKISLNHYDSQGEHPKHTFFYPFEEYRRNLLDMLAGVCKNGFGEVEIHLHHDNDTSENLRKTLEEYKNILSNEHKLLAIDRTTSEVKYGFIHGNWALDNSRNDGRWCGVNDEISVLLNTGCYADFTLPSAPSDTQTKTINSIYYAVDDPQMPKSHNTGNVAIAGKQNKEGLLCIQGPLSLNFNWRKFGIFPRIENANIAYDIPVNRNRIDLWKKQYVHVKNRPDIIFIKLHTHGTQEKNMEYFFKHNGLDNLYSELETYCDTRPGINLHYVTPRQMYNVVKGLEVKQDAELGDLLEFELILQT